MEIILEMEKEVVSEFGEQLVLELRKEVLLKYEKAPRLLWKLN